MPRAKQTVWQVLFSQAVQSLESARKSPHILLCRGYNHACWRNDQDFEDMNSMVDDTNSSNF